MAVSTPTSPEHESAPGAPSPAAPNGCEDEASRYLGDGSRSDLSDKYPAGLSSIRVSETLRSSGSEARPDARRGEAVGGVPDRPRSRSDSASSVVPGDEMERAGDVKQRRDVSIDVRLTSGERSAIDARALVLGVKSSAWVRAVALDGLDARSARIERLEAEAVLQHRPEQASAVEQLRRVGVNLNQVQRAGNATNEQLLREVLDAVTEVRAAFGDRIRL